MTIFSEQFQPALFALLGAGQLGHAACLLGFLACVEAEYTCTGVLSCIRVACSKRLLVGLCTQFTSLKQSARKQPRVLTMACRLPGENSGGQGQGGGGPAGDQVMCQFCLKLSWELCIKLQCT